MCILTNLLNVSAELSSSGKNPLGIIASEAFSTFLIISGVQLSFLVSAFHQGSGYQLGVIQT